MVITLSTISVLAAVHFGIVDSTCRNIAGGDDDDCCGNVEDVFATGEDAGCLLVGLDIVFVLFFAGNSILLRAFFSVMVTSFTLTDVCTLSILVFFSSSVITTSYTLDRLVDLSDNCTDRKRKSVNENIDVQFYIK